MSESSTGYNHPERPPGDTERLAALELESAALESIVLTPPQLADLALILSGAYRPLRGFMNQADYEAVLENLRLVDGSPFPLPVMLDVDLTTARSMETGKRITLRNGERIAFAVLTVNDVWRRDFRREAQLLGAFDDEQGRGSCYLGGSVEALRQPAHPFFARLRPSPLALSQHIKKRAFDRVLGVECGSVIQKQHHRVIVRAAAELDAAILLQPAIGIPDPGNAQQVVAIKSLLAVLPRFPPRGTLLALLEYPLRNAGLREFLMHAMLRKRYGATHFMMKGATQSVIEKQARMLEFIDQLGIEVLRWPAAAAATAGGLSSELSADPGAQIQHEHAELMRRVRSGVRLSEDDFFPEVAALLEAHYQPAKRRGFTLFFTGLSGSGKSTIARIVHARVAERDPRPVTLLGGDIMRKQFAKGLGFSREDHNTSVRRIGAAAADVTKGGGVAICCPIAPYAETRQAVRAMIEPHGSMIEIHVATPLNVCERRDPKGFYKMARQGRIQNFTGVDDPYEAPQDPDVRLDASAGTPDEAAAQVMVHLQEVGLIAKVGA